MKTMVLLLGLLFSGPAFAESNSITDLEARKAVVQAMINKLETEAQEFRDKLERSELEQAETNASLTSGKLYADAHKRQRIKELDDKVFELQTALIPLDIELARLRSGCK